jgi:hypothetical protein
VHGKSARSLRAACDLRSTLASTPTRAHTRPALSLPAAQARNRRAKDPGAHPLVGVRRVTERECTWAAPRRAHAALRACLKRLRACCLLVPRAAPGAGQVDGAVRRGGEARRGGLLVQERADRRGGRICLRCAPHWRCGARHAAAPIAHARPAHDVTGGWAHALGRATMGEVTQGACM